MGTLSAQFLTLLVIYGLPQYAQSSVALFATGFAPPIRRRRASPGAGSSSNPVYVVLRTTYFPSGLNRSCLPTLSWRSVMAAPLVRLRHLPVRGLSSRPATGQRM